MTPEGKVKKALRQYCKDNKIWVVSTPQTGTGYVGFPDYLLIFPKGITVYCEVKGENGRLSAAQTYCGMRLVKLGHNYLVFRDQPLDYFYLDKFLKEDDNELFQTNIT
jgi:hypothetical protein